MLPAVRVIYFTTLLSVLSLRALSQDSTNASRLRPQSHTGAEMAGGIPEKTGDGWETGSLSSENVDARAVQNFFGQLEIRNYTNIHSLLLVRSNRLVLEKYFAGTDWEGRHQDFNRDTPHTVQSVTKGVNALLIGIAIDRHLIHDVDERISTFFPQYAALFSDTRKKNIRVRQLLSMTAGLAWEEHTISYTDPRNDNSRMNHSGDPVQFVLERPMAAAPGTKYVYSSGNAILLGEIIRKASGLPVDEFAGSNLFKPLGMSGYAWKGPFTNGVVQTGGGLLLRPRDMAKIGSLILNHGRWQGRQVVSEEWIRELTGKQAPDLMTEKGEYGYEWRLGSTTIGKRVIPFLMSDGYAGQFILVFPSLQLVVVSTAWNTSPGRDSITPVLQYLLPAVH